MEWKHYHWWILTSIMWYFMNIMAGVIITIATIVIIGQDKEIEKLKKNAQKSTTTSKKKSAKHKNDILPK